jgi:hypothetical protein
MLDNYNIIALRFQRQYFFDKANPEQYNQMFRDMSPVPTLYWTAPGNPPVIAFRAGFDDYSHNYKRRENRTIIKGRFRNGSVGYVEADEIELYAALYKKDIPKLTPVQLNILDILEHEGPMPIQYIKDITKMLVKEITPVLHKLQEAFIVYEDQVDNEGERAWYIFESEFQDVNLNKYTRNEALKICIVRFAKLNVLIDENMVKSFFKLPAKDIKTAIAELTESGELIKTDDGYMLKSDLDLLTNNEFTMPESVFVLHRNDYLVRSNEHILTKKYTHDEFDLLYYILVDGEFRGAIFGKFTFGPFIIEEVVTDISERRDDIIEAIYEVFDREHSPIKKYNEGTAD